MPPCHTKPFVQSGVLIERESAGTRSDETPHADACDYCGSAQLEWRKCKLICADCRQINKSCADL